MELPEEIILRFEAWSHDYDVRRVSRLDRQLVHRSVAGNVFVSRIEAVGENRPDSFIGQFAFDPDHPFFFEHALDHVPGLMLIEAARQFGTATAHLHYAVEFGSAFVLDDVAVNFKRFAELSRPVFGFCEVRDKVMRRDRLASMTFQGDFVQDQTAIGTMRASMKIWDRRIYERMRRGAVDAVVAGQT